MIGSRSVMLFLPVVPAVCSSSSGIANVNSHFTIHPSVCVGPGGVDYHLTHRSSVLCVDVITLSLSPGAIPVCENWGAGGVLHNREWRTNTQFLTLQTSQCVCVRGGCVASQCVGGQI